MSRCQSCGMPLEDDNKKGTNSDGSKNDEYCVFCFKNGKFTQDLTMEQMKDYAIGKLVDRVKMDKEKATALVNETLPKLKRWAK